MSTSTEPATAKQSGPYRWYVLGVLLSVYMLHHLDRMVFSLLQEPIKHEFHLSDSQLAIMSGAAYAVSFGLAGLPLGYLADRVHRVRMLAILLTLWSGLTALGATAGGFLHLFMVRVGVGAAESGSTPTNLSLVSDYFRTKRSTAIGVYMMGAQIGTLLGFALTGVVAARFGWRAGLLVAGLPGLCLMVILLSSVREPPREVTQTASPMEALKAIGADPAMVHLIAATTVANVASAGLSIWIPSLLIRSGGMNVGSVGLAIAFTAAPLGMLGSVLAGLVTDRVALKRPDRMARAMGVIACCYIPATLLTVATRNPWIMIAGQCAHVFLHMFVSTPGYAMTVGMASPRLRGTIAALNQVLSNLIGFGIGPMVGGVLSDALHPYVGQDSLRYALGLFIFIMLWASWHHFRAASFLSRAQEAPAAGQPLASSAISI